MHVDIDDPLRLIHNVFPTLGVDTSAFVDACILSTHNKDVTEAWAYLYNAFPLNVISEYDPINAVRSSVSMPQDCSG
jgi:hypothetical protein